MNRSFRALSIVKSAASFRVTILQVRVSNAPTKHKYGYEEGALLKEAKFVPYLPEEAMFAPCANGGGISAAPKGKLEGGCPKPAPGYENGGVSPLAPKLNIPEFI